MQEQDVPQSAININDGLLPGLSSTPDAYMRILQNI